MYPGDGVLCEELRSAHPRRGGHQALHGGDAGASQADHRRQHQEQGQVHHSSSTLHTISIINTVRIHTVLFLAHL